MNKPSFLNEKEQTAASNLLDILAGLTAAMQTDVEAIGNCYKHIVESASIRHHSIHDLAHLSELTTTEKDSAAVELQNAREDLAIQRAVGLDGAPARQAEAQQP